MSEWTLRNSLRYYVITKLYRSIWIHWTFWESFFYSNSSLYSNANFCILSTFSLRNRLRRRQCLHHLPLPRQPHHTSLAATLSRAKQSEDIKQDIVFDIFTPDDSFRRKFDKSNIVSILEIRFRKLHFSHITSDFEWGLRKISDIWRDGSDSTETRRISKRDPERAGEAASFYF